MTGTNRPDFKQSVVGSLCDVDFIWILAVPEDDDAEEVTEADQDLVAYEIATPSTVLQLAKVGSSNQFRKVVPQVVAADPYTGTDGRPPPDVERLALVDEVPGPTCTRAESEGY